MQRNLNNTQTPAFVFSPQLLSHSLSSPKKQKLIVSKAEKKATKKKKALFHSSVCTRKWYKQLKTSSLTSLETTETIENINGYLMASRKNALSSLELVRCTQRSRVSVKSFWQGFPKEHFYLRVASFPTFQHKQGRREVNQRNCFSRS